MIFKSLHISENHSLKDYTSFKIGGKSRYFVEALSLDDIKAAIDFAEDRSLELFVLGGGANVLVSDNDYQGLSLLINNKGIEIIHEDSKELSLKVQAGEIWDELVQLSVDNSWWGIENLSAIPGKVGASVIQNIGAYGQELSQVLDSLEVYDRASKELVTLSVKDCILGYRRSIFNKEHKGRYIVVTVTLSLKKDSRANLSYPALQNYFVNKNPLDITLSELREAVVSIRASKLPDPTKLGNAGSFFKNLFLNPDEYQQIFQEIKSKFSESVLEKLEDFRKKFTDKGVSKIPTAFLISICDLKGKELSGVKVHSEAPLVIINTGQAKAADVLKLAKLVRQTVYRKTGAKLEPEPNFVGFSAAQLDDFFKLN